MFGRPVMEPLVTLNGALVAFWLALAVGLGFGLQSLWPALFIVAVEIAWLDLGHSLLRPPR